MASTEMTKTNGAEIIDLPAFELTKDVINTLESTDRDSLVEIESDVWKGETAGDTFFGVYLGDRPSNFVDTRTGENHPWHFFATKSAFGEAVIKRILSNAVITRSLQIVKPGTAVEITFEGESKTASGQKLNLYTLKMPSKMSKAVKSK